MALQETEAGIIAVTQRGGEEWGIEHKPIGEKVRYFHPSKNSLFLFVRLLCFQTSEPLATKDDKKYGFKY